jgi:ATP-dependent helicase/nuclease subunit B
VAGIVERIASGGGSGEADVDQLETLVAERTEARKKRHAPRWLARISDKEAEAARDFAARVAEALSPLTSILVERAGT